MNYLMDSFVQNTDKRLVPFETGFSARERFKCFNTSGIGVFCPVRHTYIFGPITDIHLCDNRLEAIIPVVIALDKNIFAVQPLFKLLIFFNSAFFPTLEDKVAQKEDRIIRFNSFIMPFDDRLMVRLRSP